MDVCLIFFFNKKTEIVSEIESVLAKCVEDIFKKELNDRSHIWTDAS